MTPIERRAAEIERDYPRGVEPTRTQIALRILREAIIVALAFGAGCGGALQIIDHEPLRLQDWGGAIGAGCLLALAKMIPTPGGGSRG